MLDPLNENLLSRANVGDLIMRSGLKFRNGTALITPKERISYWQLKENVARAANAFLKMGIKRGDRVSFLTHNCLSYIYCWFGLATIGAIAAPMNFALKGEEILYIVNDTGSKMFFVEDSLIDRVLEVKDRLKTVEVFGWIDFGKSEKPEGWIDVQQLYSEEHSSVAPEVFVDSNDQCLMIYTSGTESLPKGVVITHLNYYMNILHAITDCAFSRDDTTIVDIPLYHVGGTTVLLGFLTVGGKVIIEYAPDPNKTVDYIEKEGITYLIYPPTVYQGILGIPDLKKRNLSSLKKVTSFGAVIPQVIVDRYNEILPGLEWRNYYGSTEGNGGTVSSPQEFAEKGNSIGLPDTGFTVRLVDENDNDVPVGEVGEIVLRGPAICKKYWNKDEITEYTRRNGWHHTGDLAYMDEDGYYYFVDRKKDMIKTGGENVSSQEVEGVILRHPKVAQVAVVGLPDDYWMEAVTAFIVPRPDETITEEEIISFCKEKMAGYKVPKKVIIKSELPVNPSGKILKREIRKEYLAKGLKDSAKVGK